MESFKTYKWELKYNTSSIKEDGSPVDIIHDFYIPALQRTKHYDRMAGYFRSTSLAAASEGYTAFLRHGGHMRLIVGADMAVEDVEAVLAGSQELLTKELMQELEEAESWPTDVKNGVALLSNMVASGQLELRVALRTNGKTGAAMSIDDISDGYVHEKWFVMEDEEGNHLYGSGSLNESKTALILNAENITVDCDWESHREAKRIAMAREDFNRLWANQNAYFDVLPLPQAVQKRLVTLRSLSGKPTEIDGTVLRTIMHHVAESSVPEPSLEELLTFSVLKDAPKMPGGIYIGMYSTPVEPWPHQEMVSRRLVESWPYSYLMCDEVGLGKTIEAALAMRSLILSGRASRVLIAAPASLTSQWQHELEEKAMLHFTRSKAKPGRPGIISHLTLAPNDESLDKDLYSPKLNIVSTGLASRKERQKLLAHAEQADIILVDEAHYARRKDPQKGCSIKPKYGQLYQCIEKYFRKKAKSLWLATATPMQIDMIEVYDLLRLTRRVGPFRYDPSLTETYFELLGKLIKKDFDRKSLNVDEWRMLGRSFIQLQASDPYLYEALKKTVVDSDGEEVLRNLTTRGLEISDDVEYIIKPLFLASPLSRVMMRHTRKLLEEYQKHGQLKSKLAKRHIRDLAAIKFTEEEADFYDKLREYCDGLTKQVRKNNPQVRQMTVFLLNFLQLRFASSLYAIKKTLERRLRRVRYSLQVGGNTFDSQEELDDYLEDLKDESDTNEDDIQDITIDALLKDRSKEDLEWEEERLSVMLEQLSDMKDTPSKIQRLLDELECRRIPGSKNRMRQTVVFTRFFDTLTSIKTYLDARAPGLRVGVFSGQDTEWFDVEHEKYIITTREDIKYLFLNQKIDILLCTDAAAEGLNLQTADLLINFDMGWNPMKIEQRIGRIDRIGQTHATIDVLNMCYLGSTEEIVYGKLVNRLKQANEVVGLQQVSMLPVEPEEFRALQVGDLTIEELTRKARKRLKAQRAAVARMELSADQQYEIYQKEHAYMTEQQYPAKLDDLWRSLQNSSYLQAMGLEVHDDMLHLPAAESWLELSGTTDRNHIDDDKSFITWGNPAVDRLLEFMSSKLELHADKVKRLSVPVDSWEIVGYLVATTKGVKLITSFNELAGVQIDVDYSLTDGDIDRGQKCLEKIAKSETHIYRENRQVESINENFACVQRDLVKNVAIGLMKHEMDQGWEEFSNALKDLASKQKKVYTIELPDGFREKTEQSLFQISVSGGIPRVVSIGPLTTSAITLCERVSSSMKKKRKEQTCQDIIEQLQRL